MNNKPFSQESSKESFSLPRESSKAPIRNFIDQELYNGVYYETCNNIPDTMKNLYIWNDIWEPVNQQIRIEVYRPVLDQVQTRLLLLD